MSTFDAGLSQLKSMEELNKKQAEFYDVKKKNIATKIWSWGRGVMLGNIRSEAGIKTDVYKLHREWIGNVSGKRVLDLGCYSGNALSLELASKAGYYVGIDLSEKGISTLSEKLAAAGLGNAKALVVDFLSDEFDRERPFDLIYIYGAMHHFRYFEVLLKRLDKFLADDGCIVTYDPTETSSIIKFARVLYRPFQSDAKWEWPFTKKTYKHISQYFVIDKMQGFLGKSKNFIALSFLPFSKAWKLKKAKQWHAYDMAHANSFGKDFYRCMHVAMRLTKKKH